MSFVRGLPRAANSSQRKALVGGRLISSYALTSPAEMKLPLTGAPGYAELVSERVATWLDEEPCQPVDLEGAC